MNSLFYSSRKAKKEQAYNCMTNNPCIPAQCAVTCSFMQNLRSSFVIPAQAGISLHNLPLVILAQGRLRRGSVNIPPARILASAFLQPLKIAAPEICERVLPRNPAPVYPQCLFDNPVGVFSNKNPLVL